jgi:hypothetical protein
VKRFPRIRLLLACALSAAPAVAQDTATRPVPNVAELQKLDTVLTFIRQRNARRRSSGAPRFGAGKYSALVVSICAGV